VGVVLRVTGAAQAVLERHRYQPADRLVAVGPVVLPAHPGPVALQVGDCRLEGVRSRLGHLPPHQVAAARRQQRHALGRAEAVVEGLHPLVDPLALVLPRLAECFAVQLARIAAEDLAAESLDRLHLDAPRAAQPAGRPDRAHVALERLGPSQLLQLAHPLLGGAGLERLQQRPGGQLGARVGPPHRRTAHLPRGRVQTLEHGPHLVGAGGPVQAGRGGGAAHEPPR